MAAYRIFKHALSNGAKCNLSNLNPFEIAHKNTQKVVVQNDGSSEKHYSIFTEKTLENWSAQSGMQHKASCDLDFCASRHLVVRHEDLAGALCCCLLPIAQRTGTTRSLTPRNFFFFFFLFFVCSYLYISFHFFGDGNRKEICSLHFSCGPRRRAGPVIQSQIPKGLTRGSSLLCPWAMDMWSCDVWSPPVLLYVQSLLSNVTIRILSTAIHQRTWTGFPPSTLNSFLSVFFNLKFSSFFFCTVKNYCTLNNC